MNKNKVYLSIPMGISDKEKNDICTRLTDMGYTIFMQGKNLPYGVNISLAIKYCDIFIFMSPNMEFTFKYHDLPSEVKKEKEIALSLGKETKLCYKNRNGEYNFYDYSTSAGIVKGLSTKNKPDTYLPDLTGKNLTPQLENISRQIINEETDSLQQKQLLLFF